MKKLQLHFLLALLACFHFTVATRNSNATIFQNDDDIEAAIDEIGEELGDALESLADSFGESADEIGENFERWAEEHADELEEWKEKYADKWETWAIGLERKMERFANDQEGVWNQWAQEYEQKWERWGEELESEEFDSAVAGKLIKRNLKMLSEMPLGQMVDQLLDEGLNELGDAPWESLDELGELAANALEGPLAELSEMSEPGSDERRAIEDSVEQLQSAFGRIGDEVESAMEERANKEREANDRRAAVRDRRDPDSQHDGISQREHVGAQVRALARLLERDDLTEKQRSQVKNAIATLRDAEAAMDKARTARDAATAKRQNYGDQIRAKIDKEKRRHEESMKSFNEDLKRSSEESRMDEKRGEAKHRETDARRAKRVDGKDLDPQTRQRAKRGTDGREKEAMRWLVGEEGEEVETAGAITKEEFNTLRREIEMLRKEIRELKKDR